MATPIEATLPIYNRSSKLATLKAQGNSLTEKGNNENVLFPNLSSATASSQNLTEPEKNSQIIACNNYKLKLAASSIKYILGEALTPQEVQALGNTFGAEGYTRLGGMIGELKLHRGPLSKYKTSATASQVELAAMMYIHFLSSMETDQSSGLGSSFSRVKTAFDGNFATNFKKFLKDQGVVDDIIKKIPNRHLNEIKYDKKFTIRFKVNGAVKISKLIAPFLSSISNPNLKNSNIRDFYTKEEIKAKKIEAVDYFTKKVNNGMGDINDEMTVTRNKGDESITKQVYRREVIFGVMFFQKIVNAALRHNVRLQEGYKDLIKLIPDYVIQGLDLSTNEKKLEFVEHSIFLNVHKNEQLWAKRLFIKSPLIFIFFILHFLLASKICKGAFNEFKRGSELPHDTDGAEEIAEAGSTFSLLIKEVTKLMMKVENTLFNCGDGLHTYTESAECVFAVLATHFDNTNQDDTVKIPGFELNVDENRNLTSTLEDGLPQPRLFNQNDYKESFVWQKTNRTDFILNFIKHCGANNDYMNQQVKLFLDESFGSTGSVEVRKTPLNKFSPGIITTSSGNVVNGSPEPVVEQHNQAMGEVSERV
ncbi:MAG: hypothetical protein QG673_868 [Pseudomonadota bacterium]|nr:hypothetical protein [Pseudomonadota bacterium]